MDDDADEIMDTRPLISLDNFASNRPARNVITTTISWTPMERYIARVIIGSVPKMLIIVSS